MRQYQVPQFIDIEDKIVGPLTLKQFLYLVVGGAIVVIAYYSLHFVFFIIVALPVGLFALALAFWKVNGVPFTKISMNALNYFIKPHLYLWKQLPPEAPKLKTATEDPITKVPAITESKLQDLAWSLDIKDKLE